MQQKTGAAGERAENGLAEVMQRVDLLRAGGGGGRRRRRWWWREEEAAAEGEGLGG